MPIEGIFGAVSGAAVDNGGNVQNVAVDMVVLLRGLAFDGALSNPPDLVIASSSNPLEHFNTSWAEGAAGCVKYFKLGFEDRYSIQVPWAGDNCSGTLAITSEPQRSQQALVNLLSENTVFRNHFKQADCLVRAGPPVGEGHRVASPYRESRSCRATRLNA